MKIKSNRIYALLIAIIMMITAIPVSAVTAENQFSVVVSMEGLTLGQGFYIEPTVYTLDEINELVATEGYGPYSEENVTAGIATLAMLIDQGIDYQITGAWDSDVYLQCVAGVDKGNVDIPSIITENGGPSNNSHDGNDDEYLGEFDYSYMAGWMITVDDVMIPVGGSNYTVEDGDVIRWQFSLWGYGADLGADTGWGMPAYFEAANRATLYAAYANCNNDAAKASVLAVMENLTATQDEVDRAATVLNSGTDTDSSGKNIRAVLNATMAQLAATVKEPILASTGGEWTVLSLARGGYYSLNSTYFDEYYHRIVTTVDTTASSVAPQNGALHRVKSTENARLIIALSAIGKDPTNVDGWNLVTPFDDFSWITKQGINGPIYALIALDTQHYETADDTVRQQCVDFILSRQLADGGWALSGTTADPDITAMALQALAPYRNQAQVSSAAEAAFNRLSAIQRQDGGYASWGTVNAESIAQVVVACTAWGYDPHTDSRFVKNGSSAVDALLSFYVDEEAMFSHVSNDSGNLMATEQACYAMVAYQRFLNGENTLYDMTDVISADSSDKEITATLSLPEKVENAKGTAFQAIVDLTDWDTDAGYKLMDCIVSVPAELSVTSVSIGNRVNGGQLSYNLEENTGKLRIVYFDPQTGNDIAISGTDFPAEFLVIGFELNQAVNTEISDKLTVAVTGMSLKKNSQSDNADSMTVVDITKASDAVEIVNGISFSVMPLYTGDDVDLIASTQTAIAVAVTGVEAETPITYDDGINQSRLRYSAAISEKTGVSVYVCIINSASDLDAFTDPSNYTVSDGTAQVITFGDSNNDQIVNAQDALAAVDMWLRKTDASSDDSILSMNVNADARLNTFDALGIVEHFVNGDEFAVINKAATFKSVAA